MIIYNKYKQMSIQAKASIWYTISNFFQKGVSFIVVPLYVRLLTTAEYGEWSVFQSWRDILIIIASLNLYAGVYTKTLVDNKNDRDRYTSSMQGLGTLISLCMLILYCITHEWCNRFFELNTPIMLLLFLYFIVHPAFAFWTTRLRVEYRYKPMVIVTIAMSILTPIVSVLLIKHTNLREKGLILGFLVVQSGVGLLFYIIQFIKGKCFYDKTYWKYAAQFNIPLIPHYLSLIVLNQSDRIMIKYFCGESDAGIYSFAYQIASAINLFISAINGSRVPWTYEQLKAKAYNGLKSITNALVLMMGLITLFVSLVSPEIITIMGTDDYRVAVYVIPVVTLGVYYIFVYDLFSSIEFYYGATRYVMYASITGAILNILLNAIFIPIYGFIAAAYTTLVCYAVFMLMHYYFSKKVLKDQTITEQIYDMKTICFFSVFLTIFSLLSMFTFNSFVIRIFFIMIILVGCFIKRNMIKHIIITIKK